MDQKQSTYKSALQASMLVALSGILYGFLGFLGTKVLQDDVSISSMLFWRFFIAGFWMIPFLIRRQSINNLFNIDKRNLIFLLTLGPLCYAGSSGFYFLASQHTGTGLAMVIFFSYPILISLYSWLTQDNSFSLKTFLSLIAMTVGIILLGHNPSNNSFNSIGIVLGIVAALSYAIYIIGSKKYSSGNTNSNVLTMSISFGSAIFYLAWSLINGIFTFPSPTFKSWITILALAIFATAIPIQLMLEGLKRISSIRASIISVLEPIVTVFVGVLLLSESISHLQIFGVFVILASALLVQFQKEL